MIIARSGGYRSLFILGLMFGAGCSMAAQSARVDDWKDSCRHNHGDDQEHFCETRDVTLPASSSLSVDGRQNGGVTVHGWDKNTIQVIAMIDTWAEDEKDAEAMARDVVVHTDHGEVHADGPDRYGRHSSWSVSYEVWAPRHTELSITARNGGITVDDMDARMELETTNGGLHLTDVDGDVRGTTTNGGVTAELTGDRWHGAGLDLRTRNGGVRLVVPDSYSAQLETGTVNGSLNVDFPITVQGSIGRRISTRLGSGGATIRAMTTNGGVSIRKR